MVGGRLFYRHYFFTCSIALLLWVCLHYVEASSGKRVIHKTVGDTVELSSGLPTTNVTAARWRYGGRIVADKDTGASKSSQFKDRAELNFEDFTLTLRKLTLQDSGDFLFASAVNNKQRTTVTITLQVHEPITQPPVIKTISTWITTTCIVLLDCIAAGSVTYSWTVGNQTVTGSKQHIIREQHGETTVTCTVSNYVSEKSASETVKCSNSTHEQRCSFTCLMFIAGLFTGFLTLLLLYSLLHYTKLKDRCSNRLTPAETINQDESQQHVYSALSHGDGSVYETIVRSEDA